MNFPLIPFHRAFTACVALLTLSLASCDQAGVTDSNTSTTTSTNSQSLANGKDYGITPQTPENVQTGIEQAYAAGVKKVVIPSGVYHIPRPEKGSWHLKWSDLKNFEIDATGVTFVFTGRDRRAMLFDYCENVTLRGLTLLREVPPFSQGKVVAVAEDRRSVDIRVDAGYPMDLDDVRYFPRIPVINLYQKGSRKLKELVPDLYLSRVERLDKDLFRFHTRQKVDARIPIDVGDPAAWRGTSGSDMNVWSSRNIRMEKVTIKNGTGLAFMELCGDGGNQYIGCTITYAPPPEGATELALLSCGTDGLHSASMRKGPRIEDCLFEGLDDDSVNIHGTYAMLMEVKDTVAIVDWRSPHSGARSPFPMVQPGDHIRFYDKQGALCGEAKAVSWKALPDYNPGNIGEVNSRRFSDRKAASYWEITLDRSITAPRTGLVANSDTTGNNFVIRNSTFRNSRAHGLFIRASDGLIENCTLEGILMAGIIIAPELNSWNESDYAHNILIRGNTLRNVGIGTQPWNSGLTVAAFEYGGFVPLPGGHRNISIRDNVFENNRGANIVLTSTIKTEIIGNRFINPMSAPAFRVETIGTSNDRALIWIRQAEEVKLSNNTLRSPGAYFDKAVDADHTVKAEGLEDGVKLLEP